jgi:hypothetical protein
VLFPGQLHGDQLLLGVGHGRLLLLQGHQLLLLLLGPCHGGYQLLLLGVRHRIQLLLLLLLLLLGVRYGCQLLLVVVRHRQGCSSGRLLILVHGSSLWQLLQLHGSSLWLLRGLRRCPAFLFLLAAALLLLGLLPLLSVALCTSHWGWWHGRVLVRCWRCHPCCCCCCWWRCRCRRCCCC